MANAHTDERSRMFSVLGALGGTLYVYGMRPRFLAGLTDDDHGRVYSYLRDIGVLDAVRSVCFVCTVYFTCGAPSQLNAHVFAEPGVARRLRSGRYHLAQCKRLMAGTGSPMEPQTTAHSVLIPGDPDEPCIGWMTPRSLALTPPPLVQTRFNGVRYTLAIPLSGQ